MNKKAANTPVALVSGASRGLGLGLVKALLDGGYFAVGFSRSLSPEAGELAGRFPDRFAFLEGDLGDPPSLKRVVDHVEKKIGGINVLINNAGMVDESLLALQDEDVDRPGSGRQSQGNLGFDPARDETHDGPEPGGAW